MIIVRFKKFKYIVKKEYIEWFLIFAFQNFINYTNTVFNKIEVSVINTEILCKLVLITKMIMSKCFDRGICNKGQARC